MNVACASVAQTAVSQIGRARGLERVPASRRENRATLLDGLTTPAVFLLSIPVAFFFDGEWAKLCWLSLVVIGPLSHVLSNRAILRAREATQALERKAQRASE